MNLNVNNLNAAAAGRMASAGMDNATAVDTAKNIRPADNLVVSNGIGVAEDIPAIDIPESTFDRNDPLGKLVAAAFNLPAPPMKFE